VTSSEFEARYRERSFAAALPLAVAVASRGGPDAQRAATVIENCLVALGDFNGLGRIVGLSQQNGVPPVETFFRILHNCLFDGIYTPLLSLNEVIRPDSLLHPIALYHASCARMMLGDDDGALAGFDQFRRTLPRFLQTLPIATHEPINVMFRQGTQVLPAEGTRDRLAKGAALPQTQQGLTILRPPGGGNLPIVFCCADARYVNYFLPRWSELIRGDDRALHVHVVDPDDASLALAAELPVGLSTSRDPQPTATRYSCARFEVIPRILDAFRRPLVAVDIDSGATPRFAEVLAHLGPFDFGCFETGRCEPASVHAAGIMVFAPTAAAVGFCTDIAHYCRPKLHQAVRINWLLDQAALFSVLRLYRKDRPEFRYAALDVLTGHKMGDCITGLASDEEKDRIKIASSGASLDPSTGRVDFVWEP